MTPPPRPGPRGGSGSDSLDGWTLSWSAFGRVVAILVGTGVIYIGLRLMEDLAGDRGAISIYRMIVGMALIGAWLWLCSPSAPKIGGGS